MKRDAFSALLGASSKSSPTRTAARQQNNQQEGSRFVECPVCTKSVHVLFVNSHVDECVKESSPTTKRTRKLKADPCDDTDTPVDSIRFFTAAAHNSIDTCDGVEAAPTTDVLKCNPTPSAAASCVSNLANDESQAQVTDGLFNGSNISFKIMQVSSTPPKNAFSTLMAASALSDFREEMYLWWHDNGTLSWGWGPAGGAHPVPPGGRSAGRSKHFWSYEVATKTPDGRKAGMCELWTNLPPASTTIACQQQQGGACATIAGLPSSDDNSGVKVTTPRESLSSLSVPVLKSMLQKNIRRRRGEAAARCALELAVKSWSDAIRRVLVIVVEDSLLHPAAPLLSWLMAATSKGYRPPQCLLDAFLCMVYETTMCRVRDCTTSCRLRNSQGSQPMDFEDDGFAAPHPRDLVSSQRGQESCADNESRDHMEFPSKNCLKQAPRDPELFGAEVGNGRAGGTCSEPDTAAPPARCNDRGNSALASDGAGVLASTPCGDAAVACCRRALLMRMAYGGMRGDQALLKGACLSWGERCGHAITSDIRSGNRAVGSSMGHGAHPPRRGSLGWSDPQGGVPSLGYMHDSAISALEGNGWTSFLVLAHAGCGMPESLRSHLMAYFVEGAARLPGANINTNGGATCAGPDICDDAGSTSPGKRVSYALRSLGPIVRETDAILCGVDYHCSNVLDEVLAESSVAQRVTEAIRGEKFTKPCDSVGDSLGNQRGGEVRLGSDAGEVNIIEVAKRAMWRFSGGINTRDLHLTFVDLPEARGTNEPIHLAQGVLVSVEIEMEGSAMAASGSKRLLNVHERVWGVLRASVSSWTQRFVRKRLRLESHR